MKRLYVAMMGLLAIHLSYANDSTGYVGMHGVEYIKNKNIAMHKEQLFISDDDIKVNYQFKNLSHKNITETVLFPLPKVPVDTYGDFADTKETFESFKTWVNGKSIKPAIHARAFMYPLDEHGRINYDAPDVDVTALFKRCGLTDNELLYGWTKKGDLHAINQKLLSCNQPALKKLIGDYQDDEPIFWLSQVIYAWEQTFNANAITHIRHEYEPLVGGSVHLSDGEYPHYCVDNATQNAIKQARKRQGDDYAGNPYQAVGYVLTTGANWAKPIGQFELVVERDDDEVVSFCWAGKGKVRNIGKGKFQVIEQNFVPSQDLNIAFIKVK